MKNKFKHGELVEVRKKGGKWKKRYYVGLLPNTRLIWVMKKGERPSNYSGIPTWFDEIRAIKEL